MTELKKTGAQRIGEGGMLVGCFMGLVLTINSIADKQPMKGMEYFQNYVFWPVIWFLLAGFILLILRVLHFAFFREWLSSLSDAPFRTDYSGCRRASKNAYVVMAVVACSLGAYFVTTNFLMLITGQIFDAIQHR